jgi:hypothetical protein
VPDRTNCILLVSLMIATKKGMRRHIATNWDLGYPDPFMLPYATSAASPPPAGAPSFERLQEGTEMSYRVPYMQALGYPTLFADWRPRPVCLSVRLSIYQSVCPICGG